MTRPGDMTDKAAALSGDERAELAARLRSPDWADYPGTYNTWIARHWRYGERGLVPIGPPYLREGYGHDGIDIVCSVPRGLSADGVACWLTGPSVLVRRNENDDSLYDADGEAIDE